LEIIRTITGVGESATSGLPHTLRGGAPESNGRTSTSTRAS